MNEKEITLQDTEVSGGDVAAGSDLETSIDYQTMYNAVYDASVAAAALDLEVTDGQAVSSTAIAYFQGILQNQRLWKDYVIYTGAPYTYDSGYNERTAYEYCMVTGELDNSGTYFSGTGDVYILRLSGDVGVSLQEDQEVSLSVPLYYGRSNLGKYSGVIDRDWIGALILILLALGGVVWFVKKLLRVSY